MSGINGSGFGDDHDWVCYQKGTHEHIASWRCKRCEKWFRHFYHRTPDIFQAIQDYGIPDKCEKKEIDGEK